jgi:hypothetical protein
MKAVVVLALFVGLVLLFRSTRDPAADAAWRAQVQNISDDVVAGRK